MCWTHEDLVLVFNSNILDQKRAIEFLTLFFSLSLCSLSLRFTSLSYVYLSLSLSLSQYPYLCIIHLSESQKVEFMCNVLVVADQLLIPRLKEMCEVAVTENRESALLILSALSLSSSDQSRQLILSSVRWGVKFTLGNFSTGLFPLIYFFQEGRKHFPQTHFFHFAEL